MPTWKDHERHPLSGEYEDIDGPLWDRFLERFKKHGNYGRPITLYEGKILDGWQLYRAHVICNVEPKFKTLPSSVDPNDFVEMANDLRRHESKERAQKRVAARRERVATMIANGETERATAAALGVSRATVRGDVQSLGGGAQAATKPLCDGCKRRVRVGQELPKKCPECADMRRTSKPKTQTSKPPKDEKTDAFGNVLPARCRDAYCDTWIQETFDLLALTNEKLLKARIADGMNKRAKRYPFFVPKDFIDGVGFVTNYLDQLITHLKNFRPAGVCPACEGKGCAECRMAGLVPRKIYEELSK